MAGATHIGEAPPLHDPLHLEHDFARRLEVLLGLCQRCPALYYGLHCLFLWAKHRASVVLVVAILHSTGVGTAALLPAIARSA